MVFNSVEFLLFLPICIVGYYLITDRFKNFFLLLASYFFYCCSVPKYLFLLVFSTVVTWFCSIMIEKQHSVTKKKFWLALSVIPNIGMLFYYKYTNLLLKTIDKIFNIDFNALDIILPVGISFFIFQAVGYSIDVYRESKAGNKYAELNFIDYALFVSFFPQLVAGPIERSSNLLPQFKSHPKFSFENFIYGMRLILVGMFKKIVIADMLALFVDAVFENSAVYNGLTLLFGVFAFSIQIYCDFSGYTDIARGCTKILGKNLMVNFNAPYFSASIKEFWSRWHISLSTWFKDYVYFPLGGSYHGFMRKCLNLFIVFMVSGLWHGAAYGFILWGMLHGVYRIVEEFMHGRVYVKQSKIIVAFKTLFIFVLVSFTWIFFRAKGLTSAVSFINNMIMGWGYSLLDSVFQIREIIRPTIQPKIYLSMVVFGISLLCYSDYKQKRDSVDVNDIFIKLPQFFRWVLYYAMTFLCMICFLLNSNEYGQAGSFIYFQF